MSRPAGSLTSPDSLMSCRPCWVSIRVDSNPVDGVSLTAMMRGEARDVELDAYSESLYPRRFGWSSLRALRAGRYKLIDAPRPELYDLERDPFEQRNIYDERRPLAAALARRLGTFGAALAPGSRSASAATPSDEVRQRLASLGYIAADPPSHSSQDTLIFPTRRIASPS
jgi:hypothetical protein